MAIVSGVFPPFLGRLEVVVDGEERPKGHPRPLQPQVGPVITPVALVEEAMARTVGLHQLRSTLMSIRH